MLQLRGHNLTATRMYTLALTLRPHCQQYETIFIVNDRIDIGLATGADGFQLGANSLPLHAARQLTGEEHLLGVSVHSVEEAQAAVTGGADFLLAGTIFASRSHPEHDGCGPGLLREIKQRAGVCPLLAIGGITSKNVRSI